VDDGVVVHLLPGGNNVAVGAPAVGAAAGNSSIAEVPGGGPEVGGSPFQFIGGRVVAVGHLIADVRECFSHIELSDEAVTMNPAGG